MSEDFEVRWEGVVPGDPQQVCDQDADAGQAERTWSALFAAAEAVA